MVIPEVLSQGRYVLGMCLRVILEEIPQPSRVWPSLHAINNVDIEGIIVIASTAVSRCFVRIFQQ